MPAPVDSALPPGLAGWSEDLLLPAATTSAQVGFNPVTFAGATGTSPASFAAQFGDGLLSMWRFDAAGQRWLSFIAGAPARVNTLTTLGTRDALLVKTAQATTVQQIDFIPRTGAARSVLLEAGGNLVSYTGGGGDIAALTAAVGGLRTVSVFDARDQRWRVFVRGAPPQVSQVSTLSRLDAVFIRRRHIDSLGVHGRDRCGLIPVGSHRWRDQLHRAIRGTASLAGSSPPRLAAQARPHYHRVGVAGVARRRR